MAVHAPGTIDRLVERYEERLRERAPGSFAMREDAASLLCGGVSSHFKGWQPFYVREASGAHLVDIDGNAYVDLIMGFGPNMLGHGAPVVLEAVREAFSNGTSLAIATPREVELARAIRRLVPSVERMRFVTTGTEATMMALRTARAYTGATRIARFEGHYHGQHDLALVSVARTAGLPERPEPVADGAGIPERVLGDVVVLPWNDPGSTERLLREHASGLAALILEPVPFSNLGGNEPESGFLELLRRLTAELGILLVFDEVITGFRLELGGAAARFGITPDLHVFGKTVGGGFPIGVYGGRADVMEAAVTPRGGDPHGSSTIFQSGTFSGTPPSMAAGLAMLQELERGEAIPAANARAEQLRSGLRERATQAGVPCQVTGTSSWFGVYFTDRPIRGLRDAMTADRARQRAFSLGLLAGGVYLAPSHPGFTSAAHSEADIHHVLMTAEAVLDDIAATT